MSDKPHVDLDDPDSIFHTDTEYSTGSYSCSDDKCDQSDCGGLHTYSNSSASETSNYEGLDVGSDDGGVEQPEKINNDIPFDALGGGGPDPPSVGGKDVQPDPPIEGGDEGGDKTGDAVSIGGPGLADYSVDGSSSTVGGCDGD